MKAAIWTAYGPPVVLKVREVKTPEPKEDEVLVKIHAANVFPGDCEMRRFEIHPFFWFPVRLMTGIFRPRLQVLGQEFAGEVVQVGNKVTRFHLGDRIFAPLTMFGAYAEYIVVRAHDVSAVIPDNISYEEAAAVSVGGLNALDFLRIARVKPGDKVLLHGAAGSIGTMAVQLARVMGAEVTALDTSAKLPMLASIGASHVIDYTREDFSQNGVLYDAVIDFAGKSPFTRSLRSIREGGYYVHGNGSAWTMVRRIWASRLSGRNVRIALTAYRQENLDYLCALLADGKIKPVIDRQYALDEVVEAHRYVESGRKAGNVVLTIS